MIKISSNIQKFRKGYMDMFMLKVLSEEDCYGYEIISLFRSISNDIMNFTIGSIYPALYKLEKEGYIQSYTKDEHTKMERVYYHITEKGEDALEEMVQDYRAVTKAADALLNYSKKDYQSNVS